jgi:hypothetical protein
MVIQANYVPIVCIIRDFSKGGGYNPCLPSLESILKNGKTKVTCVFVKPLCKLKRELNSF